MAVRQNRASEFTNAERFFIWQLVTDVLQRHRNKHDDLELSVEQHTHALRIQAELKDDRLVRGVDRPRRNDV